MARTLAYFYLAGAALAACTLLVPGVPEERLAPMLVLIALAFVCGLLLHAHGHRLPDAAVPVFLAIGSAAITAAVYIDGHGDSAYALYYVWVGAEAFYFLTRRQAALQMALMAAAYAWALTVLPADMPAQRWLLTVGTGVTAGLVIASQRGRIERLVERLSDAARTDPLTGLLNRRAFEEQFELELERSRRSGRPLSVVVGDLDGFKGVNDRLGHAAGDLLLEALAGELVRWKRRVDVAARIGGEEFALLLPQADERGAFIVAERLRHAVLRAFAAEPLPLTISFGLASWPSHGDDADALLDAADRALYGAKHMGRDRTVIFSAEVARALRPGDEGEIQLATVVNLAEALDIRDTGTARHSQSVGRYARMMADEIGLPPERVERVRIAGVLHDVGKIGIADRVLNKAGPLDPRELAEMRAHPQIAARLLSRPEFVDLRAWILAHHERPDGRGYPYGLRGEEIPLEARILAVADAYEAMTADRVYRPALGEAAARAELERCSGAQFDEAVVDAFMQALGHARLAVA
jgi:diguanylate cyclase (GGDEF)-like protein